MYVLTLHFGYFRPGEGITFLADDLVFPAYSHQKSLSFPALVVAPSERLLPSKSQTVSLLMCLVRSYLIRVLQHFLCPMKRTFEKLVKLEMTEPIRR